ncbi:MAG: alpha-1,4-glucan--maltose-1-phosphate maltosyltransferase [Candidatus Latescibacterota bacterium]
MRQGTVPAQGAAEARRRAVVEDVQPQVDCGRFAVKRVTGEPLVVLADVFCDGHDAVAALLLYRRPDAARWEEVPMEPLGNDRWRGRFTPTEVGAYEYTVEAWVDHFTSWQRGLRKKREAGQEVRVELLAGAELVEAAARRAEEADAGLLAEMAGRMRRPGEPESALGTALGPELALLMQRYPDRTQATRWARTLPLWVDRRQALYSTWYERFPRSCSPDPGRTGTLRDCRRLLPEIARMGFDVLYLPPIHPIGRTQRKGRNNAPVASPADPGSPWAVGAAEGGHTAIHSDLGSFEDFAALQQAACEHGIELALDLAFQCSADHPYLEEHPEWFRRRPDGTIQYAENPPKRYEDIYPIDFETEDWQALWEELQGVVLFWVERGVRIFRVDNPHTKAFPFWEWLTAQVHGDHPDVLFLSEAFTRPRVMHRLAKLGFSQSYTYFTWRNTKPELTQYLTELTGQPGREYLRPSFWPTTPDILPEYLQYGGRPAFVVRLLLAATLSSSYGIYGPAYELCVNQALPGRKEYQDSEKYEIRHWDWDQPGNLRDFIARVNRIRREQAVLQTPWNLRFLEVDNEYLLFFAKEGEPPDQALLIVVNLDPFRTQSRWVRVPLADFGIAPNQPYLCHDLLSEERYIWHGERNFVQLDPHVVPAHILKLRSRLRREADFDYFM